MGINLIALAEQGRAYSSARCWTAEELESVILLTKSGLSRINAANHVRNGILTVEDYEKASKKGFVPKTLEQAHGEAEEELSKRGKVAKKKTAKKKVASKKK